MVMVLPPALHAVLVVQRSPTIQSPVFRRLAIQRSLAAAVGTRIDFQYNTNVGYAFVNFTDPEAIIDFVNNFVNKEWQVGYHPRKIAQVSYATVQGIDSLIEKFRNSAIIDSRVQRLPSKALPRRNN
ncbi:uncharacterized protein MYCFIDRAFT_78275 [Pseudocercospora fijiensis CIRAD86]|uniref:Mei2-like C-terminal RNA recognition motif domain-containing protein n=1 Tax=Pseudocercospora fijiensis (strain CIRAD86) TaxID=383855 RepID=M3A7I1_PSEFD|nr:uncharacterized protein MYCFIDRAFT_78275 [Pseudocercospora fijiensis CIRAD86]EME80576.1 hypothetical protein MYCFIDRAFT_78275 [Pseudocercospora fijiensis CIRAD86]